MENPDQFWTGAEGDAYQHRNPIGSKDLTARRRLWAEILDHLHPAPRSILEIGAGQGANLLALQSLSQASLAAVEPNQVARQMLHQLNLKVVDEKPEFHSYDLVFTSGVLIHIPPEKLKSSMFPIWQAAKQWIGCIEYYSDQPESVLYQDKPNLLWKRDFGDFWLKNFPLEPIACGFAWRELTGLDNVTWWILRRKDL